MSDTDFILTPGFKQLEMLTPGLSVLPCCFPCLPRQQERSAWFLGMHLTFYEESWPLYLERFPSSECDPEFSLVQCAIHRVATSPGLWRWGVTKGRNGERQILFSLSPCVLGMSPWGRGRLWTHKHWQKSVGQLCRHPRLPLLAAHGSSVSPAAILCAMLSWKDGRALWSCQNGNCSAWREYSTCRHLSASWADFGLSISSFLCPTEKAGPASSPLAGRWLRWAFSEELVFGVQRGISG